MKIIVAHNFYRNWGGEDQVFHDEVDMLVAHGHDVETFTRHNDDFSGLETIKVAAGTVWNRPAAKALEELVHDEQADIVHFHNWLPQISQAAFYGARRGGAAVVQTVHNYRSTCANGVLFRDGDVCEKCLGKAVGWSAIRHACYRDSRIATVPVVTALATHRALKTAERSLDALIVLSAFARDKLAEGGLPKHKMHIKPNFFSPDPGERFHDGDYVVFIGRLIDNKGLATLIEAWDLMDNPPLLKIAGSGPMQPEVEAAAAKNQQIEYLGLVDPSEIPDLLGKARSSIVPSLNYEGFPKSIVESFAVGTPVIASEIGSLTEIIEPGSTGLRFPPGDAAALASAVGELPSGEALNVMRAACRSTYVERYSRDRNYQLLMEIYEAAIAARRVG